MAAYHLQMAGDVGGAVRLWIDAARLSARRSGFVEAIAQLQGPWICSGRRTRARAACSSSFGCTWRWAVSIPSNADSPRPNAAGPTLMHWRCVDGWRRAVRVCRACRGGIGRDHTRKSLAIAGAGGRVSRAGGATALDPPFVMGHVLMGGTLFLNGEFAQSRRHLDEALRLYQEDRTSRADKRALLRSGSEGHGALLPVSLDDDHGAPGGGIACCSDWGGPFALPRRPPRTQLLALLSGRRPSCTDASPKRPLATRLNPSNWRASRGSPRGAGSRR